MRTRRRFLIEGVVQGVGFRPYVYRVALELDLDGWVLNDGTGVEIVVEGERVADFLPTLRAGLPPLARIARVREESLAPVGESGFAIRHSARAAERSAAIPPDAALCDACRRELLDPNDRRHRYPFINCTHCGPRLTIVQEVPYDRPRTTMRDFPLCPDCEKEYTDPMDRRFHAEPVACPACGPALAWRGPEGEALRGEEALEAAVDLLAAGGILALQGLGGFHLACDAVNPDALARLRERKRRPDKPFAVMVGELAGAEALAELTSDERTLLAGPESPIALVRKKADNPLAPAVAPAVGELGVMVAYTPLHRLLFATGEPFAALVMTSGNRQDEPIARTPEEAFAALAGIADAWLIHDRPIHNRADDSIARVLPGGHPQLLRRARGYVPRAVPLAVPAPLFAAGAELKSTFLLARPGLAYPCQHIGDLQEERAWAFYRETYAKFCRLLDLEPAVCVCDRHPDYLSTRFAETLAAERGLPLVRVQHHRAHVASVLAEHDHRGPVLGVAFDGTGLGDDGTVWGGEFFLGAGRDLTHYAALEPFHLPGGDLATRQVWRIALSLLRKYGVTDAAPGSLAAVPAENRRLVGALVDRGPLTSSVGRLFDAAAVLAGLGAECTYEAGAAMALEGAVRRLEAPYPFTLAGTSPLRLGLGPLVAGLVADAGDPARIAGRFHTTLAGMVLAVAERARHDAGVETVALSGGVFQNRVLIVHARRRLEEAGFRVLANQRVPANDGGICLGQAWLGAPRDKE